MSAGRAAATPREIMADQGNTRMRCPSCGTIHDAESTHCTLDGAELEPAGQRDPLIGTLFQGRFHVEERLDEGGMGAVYRARQLNVDRPVALKVLHPEWADDRVAVRRFLIEARATSQLTNAHTVTIYDFGETAEGRLFIAMEYLEGRSLSARIEEEGALPPDEAIRIVDQAAQSLSEAHALGIVHRDMKPENVFLARKADDPELVKVLDFGLARAHTVSRGQKVTRTGMTTGTPGYMAPEMVTADGSDARADVYALGVMLHEALVGKPPFEADTPFLMMQKHLSEKPPALVERTDRVPPAISDFVQRCMAKKPADRPPDAAAFRRELEAASSGHATRRSEPPAGASRGGAGAQPGRRSRGADAEQSTDAFLAESGLGRRWTGPAASVAILVVGAALVAGMVLWAPWSEGPRAGPSAGERASAGEEASEGGSGAALEARGGAAGREGSGGGSGPGTAGAAPPDEPEAEPSRVTLSVTSRPQGARVLRDGEFGGETPLMMEVERSEEPVELELKHEDYRDHVLERVPDRDRMIEVDLQRLEGAASGGGVDAGEGDGGGSASERDAVARHAPADGAVGRSDSGAGSATGGSVSAGSGESSPSDRRARGDGASGSPPSRRGERARAGSDEPAKGEPEPARDGSEGRAEADDPAPSEPSTPSEPEPAEEPDEERGGESGAERSDRAEPSEGGSPSSPEPSEPEPSGAPEPAEEDGDAGAAEDEGSGGSDDGDDEKFDQLLD